MPTLIVTSALGVCAYAYTTFQIQPLKVELSSRTGSFLPHSIEHDIWETSYGLGRYIEYRKSGSVEFSHSTGKRVVPTISNSPPVRNWSYVFPDQVTIYVPTDYQQMDVAQLENEKAKMDIRLRLARVLDRRAEFLDGVLSFAASLAALMLAGRLIALFFERYWSIKGRDHARVLWVGLKVSWRRIAVLASIIWAFVAALGINPRESAEFALVLGPFVISLAVYLLVPKRQGQPKSIDRN